MTDLLLLIHIKFSQITEELKFFSADSKMPTKKDEGQVREVVLQCAVANGNALDDF